MNDHITDNLNSDMALATALRNLLSNPAVLEILRPHIGAIVANAIDAKVEHIIDDRLQYYIHEDELESKLDDIVDLDSKIESAIEDQIENAVVSKVDTAVCDAMDDIVKHLRIVRRD